MLNTTTRAGLPAGAIAERLLAREAELRALLQGSVPAAADAAAEVSDFKDAAGDEAAAAVTDAQAAQAAHELEQVMAAVRRLQDGSYGECTGCGAVIDPRRLQALPATPYCTACQEAREHAGSAQ